MEVDFEKIFSTTLKSIRLCLCDPNHVGTKKWWLQFVAFQIPFVFMYYLISYSILYRDIKADDFSKLCKNLALGTLYVVMTFQACNLMVKKEVVAFLLQSMRNDYDEAKKYDLEQKKIIIKCGKRGARIQWGWVLLLGSSALTFLTKSLLVYVYNFCIGDFTLVAIYDIAYPPIIDQYKDNVCVYIVLYVMSFYYLYCTAIMGITTAPLGPILMVHASGQLELLAHRVQNVFVRRTDKEAYDELKKVAANLERIHGFVRAIDQVFTISYDMGIRSSTLISPIILHEMKRSMMKGESLEFAGFIVICSLYNISVCYFGEKVIEKGETLRNALYTCGWEKQYDLRIRKLILLLQIRATKPLAPTLLFTDVCMETLSNTFQQSYSIFNLLNAMWD